MSDDKKKKKGFFSRAFGLKSKADKQAEEAAKRAESQQRVDAEMAARMAAINAAALKSAREQDLKDSGIDLAADETAKIEAEEKALAEQQAKKDLETARKLTAEKRAKELEAKRLAEEEAAFKASEAERKAVEEKERQARDAADAKRKAKDAAQRQAEEAARLKAAKDADEAARLKAELDAQEKLRLENEAATAKAASEAEEAARLEAEKTRLAELEARKKQAAEQAAKEAAQDEERRAAQRTEDARIAAELAEEQAAQKAALKAENDAREGGFLSRISKGLSRSTSTMSENMAALFTKRKLDNEAIQDLEDLLIGADLGVGPSMKVSEILSKDRFNKDVTDTEIKIALAGVISDVLAPLEKPLSLTGAKPEIMLFVGVNGSGKTTTLGKIAKRYADDGKRVLIVAGDTFRAAADAQLKVWGERAGAPVLSAKHGADAAGLVYDAVQTAKDENYDVLMIDTAGRLQNRTELMDELAKVVRVIKKHDESAPHHSILVLDATVGQNALLQTEAFEKVAGVTGLIMTKLDGTAKGGVLVALSDKFKLPIHAIGIGERIEDLENFSAPVFAAALSGIAQELDG
ncbi:MAG: signal recognition particle-docking protein FtsY [Maricaulaceae bacterium]